MMRNWLCNTSSSASEPVHTLYMLCKKISIIKSILYSLKMNRKIVDMRHALKTFSLNNPPSARISLRSATPIYISPLTYTLPHIQQSKRSRTTSTMPEIIDDKSQHCIPFLLGRVKAHQARYASNPDQAPPLFLGLNGVQGAGKTVLVSAFPPQYLILC